MISWSIAYTLGCGACAAGCAAYAAGCADYARQSDNTAISSSISVVEVETELGNYSLKIK